MTYEFENLIVNIFTAVGTCGAVIVALWSSMPKKEQATGYFEFDNSNISDKNILELKINNVGNKNIWIDYKAGAFIKLNDKNEFMNLRNDSFHNSGVENLFIPKKGIRYLMFATNSRHNNDIKKIYENKNCTLSVYTVKGTEIELKKFSNKDPLGIGKKKAVAVGK